MTEEETRLQIWKDIQKLTIKENWDRRDLTMLLQAAKVVELGYEGYCKWLESMKDKTTQRLIDKWGKEKYNQIMNGEYKSE